MKEYFDTGLLIAAIGLLLHLDRCVHKLRYQFEEHTRGHFHEIKEED